MTIRTMPFLALFAVPVCAQSAPAGSTRDVVVPLTPGDGRLFKTIGH